MIALTRDASGGDIYVSKKQGRRPHFHYSKILRGTPRSGGGQSPLTPLANRGHTIWITSFSIASM